LTWPQNDPIPTLTAKDSGGQALIQGRDVVS